MLFTCSRLTNHNAQHLHRAGLFCYSLKFRSLDKNQLDCACSSDLPKIVIHISELYTDFRVHVDTINTADYFDVL